MELETTSERDREDRARAKLYVHREHGFSTLDFNSHVTEDHQRTKKKFLGDPAQGDDNRWQAACCIGEYT